MWRDVIELGNATETLTLGEMAITYTWHTVYANKKGVRQSEFYQASATGLKPEMVFEIRSEEYNNDELLRYNNVDYAIIRTYDKGEFTELTVEAYVGSDV